MPIAAIIMPLTRVIENSDETNNIANGERSPLYWSKEYTPTDLMEILAGLARLGAVRTANGSPANFLLIVRTFEKVFNMKIPNHGHLRWATVNRKLRLTHFLDLLKQTLVDASQQ